ncbi:MAG TPA: hypothetical protein PKD59_11565 [Miltoncostaeaceae bacterium]|nr:hypothetical protein [Miltoncostaeaceae bacterium]
MKALFVVIGVIVIFGILFSSGAFAGSMCLRGVGCVTGDSGGVSFSATESSTITTAKP